MRVEPSCVPCCRSIKAEGWLGGIAHLTTALTRSLGAAPHPACGHLLPSAEKGGGIKKVPAVFGFFRGGGMVGFDAKDAKGRLTLSLRRSGLGLARCLHIRFSTQRDGSGPGQGLSSLKYQ